MARSGLQKEVLKMYKAGVKNAMSKSKEERPNFLLQLRYTFHNPPLTSRDYAAIEHKLRRFSYQLEMLQDPSVKKMHVNQDMQDWWANEIAKAKARAARAALEKEKAQSSASASS